ncbi:MAG: beta-propeller fold lactonase family protein [Fimbriimonadaceae bacterium]|nr:beta-propeller fold lactonase family protein [Alphaproteobacteria bacterium]
MNKMQNILLTLMSMAAMLLASVISSLADGKVYIPLGSAHKIAVIDSSEDKVVATIKDIAAVHGLAGTPDGKFLIAGSYQEREATAGMPDGPASVSEDDHAAHHGAQPANANRPRDVISTVSIINLADNEVVRRVDVPGAVHHVAASPDGRFAAVTRPGGGGISVIDLNSYEVIASIQTGSEPNYLVFSPDSNAIYVSNAGDDTVTALDTGNWKVEWTADVGESPEHIVLSADGKTLFVNNVSDGNVSVVSVQTRKTMRTLEVGAPLHGIDISDDGTTLFVADQGNDRLVSISVADGTVSQELKISDPYHLAAVKGTGKLYLSSVSEPKIWVIDQSSLAIVGEIEIGGKGHQMVQG